MKAALVLGLVNGLTTALLAMGLVLVYKAARFVNFAHAQLGVTSALVLGKLVLDWHWSWWLAFPVAVALGAGIGAAAEVLVIRRLAGRSRLSLLIATIGISQVLLALTYFKFLQADPVNVVQKGYPVPLDTMWHVDALILRGHHVMILALVPLVAVGLGFFMQRTVTGRSIRAAASNPDAAVLAGVSVRRVSVIAWAIAGALSAVTAVLQAPAQATFDLQALGPGLLLRALGAAAIGGLASLPVAFGGGVVLGMFEGAALYTTRDGGAAEAVVFVLILVALFVRSRALRQASGGAPDRLELDERPPVVPAAVARRPIVVHHRRLFAGISLVVGLVLPLLPPFRSHSDRFLLTIVLVYSIVGLSLTILTGWAGQVSLGQYAFVGVGAYMAARAVPAGWSLPASMLLGGVVGAVIAVLIGLPALRLSGLTLAVTTLGFAVVAPGWLFSEPWFGEPGNISVGPPHVPGIGLLDTQLRVYYTSLVALGLALAATAALRRSRSGRLIVAVRDNERAAAAFGVPPTVVKLSTFALSGFLASAAGVLWAAAWRNVSDQLFGAHESLLVLAIPVIGGLGSLPGAVLGAAFVFGVPAFLGDAMKSVFSNSMQFALFMAGIGLIVTQIRFPGGIAVFCRRGWERLLARLAVAEEARLQRDADAAESADGAVLAVNDVVLHFGGVAALDGVSIDVKPGEIVGLIGSNGAGKTTLVNAIAGLVTPESGSIRAFGRELLGMAPEYRAHFGVARSFQDARLFPGLTVRETIQVALAREARVGFVASLLGAPWVRFTERRTRVRADELIERLGLAAWANHPTGELSTGTRRICDLTAQMAARPKLLLLDEPTAGVAQREAEAFGPLLRRIRDELDGSILIIEHDMPLMLALADRIYCLEAGRVIAEGTPEEIRNNPRVIASYLGTDEVAIERSGRRPARPARKSTAQVGANGNGSAATRSRATRARATAPVARSNASTTERAAAAGARSTKEGK